MAELIAIKKCGKHKPGEVFEAKSSQAKLLVAIKSARYMTRDMVAETIQIPVVVYEEDVIKKTRGRPRINVILDSTDN